MATADVLTTMEMQDCWTEGLLDTVSWGILPSLRIYQAFSRAEVNQLKEDVFDFGRNTAGAVLTQIARYSPIPMNPQVCQMKVLSGHLHSESQGLLPFSSREVNLWVIEPHALVTKRTGNPVVSV